MTASAPSVLAFTGIQWILIIVFIIPLAILWGYAAISIIRRHDLGLGAKVVWLIGVFIFILIGPILYFMLRPSPQEQNRRAQQRHKQHH